MKQTLVLSCPVDTFSGYGARSRDIVKALLKADKYDIKILAQRWGNTPIGFLNADNELHRQILDLITYDYDVVLDEPDIWVQITVPNEFEKHGKFNIGITAGIETDLCSLEWLIGMNKMDLVLVSSEHAKRVFEISQYKDDEDKFIRTTTPVKVLFEGVDTDIFKPQEIDRSEELAQILNDIGEPFNFLFVGHWLPGKLGHDRKDIGMLVKTFLETFKGKPTPPGLILKTSGGNYSIMDRDAILSKIESIQKIVGDIDKQPNIYLLHGELSDEEMNLLYNHPKVKAFVSFTKGEGFGRPLLEASTSGKPTIVSGWSGHLDFLPSENNILLPGTLDLIDKSTVQRGVLIPESKWFTVDYKQASKTMLDVRNNYKKFIDNAKKQSYISKTKFSLDKMGEKLIEYLT